MTDPIADYLTRIRNAFRANHKIVEIAASNVKKRMTEILYDNGYINGYKYIDTPDKQNKIKIALKYDPYTHSSTIKNLIRISKLGRKYYVKAKDLPRVLNGLGIAIVSTSRGVMTNKEAKQQNLGGEVICYVY